MIVQTIKVNDCAPQTIVIGRRGTYDTLQIEFDLSYLVESYGNGVAVLAVKRSQDESAYPAVVTQENNTLTWTVSETDTYYVGAGEAQLMWYVDGGLAKTIIYPMVVMRDILATAEEPPEGYENWIEHLTGLGAETQQNAQKAAQSASEAKASAEAAAESEKKAEDAADLLENVSATATTLEPGQPATAEYDEGVFKFGIPKGDKLTYADLTEADKEDLVQGPIKAAQDAAVDAVGTAKTNAVDAVNGAGTTQVQNVNSAGTTNVNAVNQAGETQVNTVNQAGATQAQAVEDKGEEVIASIPSDYSDLTAEVDDLTRQLNDETTGLDTKAPVIIETASGAIASFDDGADSMPIRKLVAQIEPVQDLHGYDNPWPGGGGRNLLDWDKISVSGTHYGMTFTKGSTEGTVTISGTLNYDGAVAPIRYSDYSLSGKGYVFLTEHISGDSVIDLSKTYGFRTESENTIAVVLRGTYGQSYTETIRISVYAPPAPATWSPYSNLCPISGHTGMTVTRTGKNLFDKAKAVLYSNVPRFIKYGVDDYADTLPNGDCVLDVGTYTFSISGDGTEAPASMAAYDSNGNRLAIVYHSKILMFTTTSAGACYLTINFVDVVTWANYNIQLESGSTATAYEPYTGNQISVNWEDEAGTVYGGEDEVIGGSLIVDYGQLVINDQTNFAVSFSDNENTCKIQIVNASIVPAMKPNNKTNVTILADSLKVYAPDYVYTHDVEGISENKNSSSAGLWIRINKSRLAENTKNGVLAYLSQNPIQVVYPLAEPVEYTLTGNEMETLYGTNNIWSSTGDTEVEYCADTKLYIDGKITQAIAAALNA